jgi:hypothetical protein
MDSLQRIVTRQFNDLTQKRQSTQLKSYSDDFPTFDEPVPQQHTEQRTAYPSANPRPIKKVAFNLTQQNLCTFLANQYAEEHVPADRKPRSIQEE